MYGHSNVSPAVAASAGAGALPFTGLNLVWVVVLGLTLIAVGIALSRIIPRKEV